MRKKTHRNRARRLGFFREGYLVINIQYDQDAGGGVSNAPDLLLHAVFKNEGVVQLKRWIEMAVIVEGHDGQAHLFCEDLDTLLIFALFRSRLWCGLSPAGLSLQVCRGCAESRKH